MNPLRAPLRPAAIAHADRLFPVDLTTRTIARRLYDSVRDLPIIAPSGRADARLFAEDAIFPDPARLVVASDPSIVRVLHSHGVGLEELGMARRDRGKTETDPREIFRRFAENYHLLNGTPARLWLDHAFATLFGLTETLSLKTADSYFDRIASDLEHPRLRPRALFEKYRFEAIANPESPIEELRSYSALKEKGFRGRVTPVYAPDAVADPDASGFVGKIDRLGELTNTETRTWRGYLDAHRRRRSFFKSLGATASWHCPGGFAIKTLSETEAGDLFAKVVAQQASPSEAALFRGQVLAQMAEMSLDDGLAMRIDPGLSRERNAHAAERFESAPEIEASEGSGRALKPLLDRFGNERKLQLIVTAPAAGQGVEQLAAWSSLYPALCLGSRTDGPAGLKQFRELSTPIAGFYKTAICAGQSHLIALPARHDMARRVECSHLAELVASHQMSEEDAYGLAGELCYGLTKRVFRL